MRSLSAITAEGTRSTSTPTCVPRDATGPLSRSLAPTRPTGSAGPSRGSTRRCCGCGVAGDDELGARFVERAQHVRLPGATDVDPRPMRRMKARLEKERIPRRVEARAPPQARTRRVVRRRVDRAAAPAAPRRVAARWCARHVDDGGARRVPGRRADRAPRRGRGCATATGSSASCATASTCCVTATSTCCPSRTAATLEVSRAASGIPRAAGSSSRRTGGATPGTSARSVSGCSTASTRRGGTAHGEAPPAVVFDCDGTIADTESLSKAAWRDARRARLRGQTTTSARHRPDPFAHNWAYFASRSTSGPRGVPFRLRPLPRRCWSAILVVYPDAVTTIRSARRGRGPWRWRRRRAAPTSNGSSSRRDRRTGLTAVVAFDDVTATSPILRPIAGARDGSASTRPTPRRSRTPRSEWRARRRRDCSPWVSCGSMVGEPRLTAAHRVVDAHHRRRGSTIRYAIRAAPLRERRPWNSMMDAVDLGLLLLRVVVGVGVSLHGMQKLFGWFTAAASPAPPRWFASLGFGGGKRATIHGRHCRDRWRSRPRRGHADPAGRTGDDRRDDDRGVRQRPSRRLLVGEQGLGAQPLSDRRRGRGRDHRPRPPGLSTRCSAGSCRGRDAGVRRSWSASWPAGCAGSPATGPPEHVSTRSVATLPEVPIAAKVPPESGPSGSRLPPCGP
jgi:hypothetical protein